MVAAIREMLSAADLPLGLERERLLEQSLNLQAQLKATQAALGHQRAVRLLSQHRIPPTFYASWQGPGQSLTATPNSSSARVLGVVH